MKTANFTPKQKQTIRIVKQALIDNPNGLTLDEIHTTTGLSIATIQTTLKVIENEIIKDSTEQSYALAELVTTATPANETADETDNPVETAQNDKNCETEMPKLHKPCTTSKITGYHIKGENVRIFLDKRHNAESITLSLGDLTKLAKVAKFWGEK